MWVRAVKKLHSRRDLGASALPASESRDPPRGPDPHRIAPHRTALITLRISLLADASRGESTNNSDRNNILVIVTTVYVSHNQPQIDSLDINNIFGYVIVSR